MHKPTLIVVAAALAVLGWSGLGSAASAPPKCADLGGVQGPDQVCTIQATDPQYSLKISYPADYPDAGPVFDYIKQTRDGFLNVAKTPDARTMPYELETTQAAFTSNLPPRDTRSVVFKTYQGVGGAHPTTFYKAFTWDQKLRAPITIDTLFREGTAPFPIIFPMVQAEVAKQLGQPMVVAPEAGLDSTKYANFAITNDQLIFFFSQGDLFPEAAGALQVAIPRGPLDALLA